MMALSCIDGFTYFGQKYKLPSTTIFHSNTGIGDNIRSYPEVQKLSDIFTKHGFPFLIVGGAIRDLICDPTCKPKDVDVQVVGAKLNVLAKLQQYYLVEELTTNPIGIVVGHATESIDAIDLREAMEKYFHFDYVESNVNALMFDLHTDQIIDLTGNGVSDCEKKKFRVVASSMTTWNEFPEPPRKFNGKLIRVLKMYAKGFTFAHQCQEEEFIKLFETTFDSLCDRVVADKFSTFQMVLGHTVRGDTLNYKEGTTTRGNKPLYNRCIEALAHMDLELANKLVAHMG